MNDFENDLDYAELYAKHLLEKAKPHSLEESCLNSALTIFSEARNWLWKPVSRLTPNWYDKPLLVNLRLSTQDNKSEVTIGIFSSIKKTWTTPAYHSPQPITHWMELPNTFEFKIKE